MTTLEPQLSSLGLIRPSSVDRPGHWRLALMLGIAGGMASLLLMPYALALLPDVARGIRISLPLFAAAQAIQSTVLVTLLAWIGLRLGYAQGLDAPWLRHWVRGSSIAATAPPPRWAAAASLGAIVGVVVIALQFVLPAIFPSGHSIPVPGAWQGLLASFYGGIVEETICRLLFVSLFVWIGARLSRSPPAAGVYVAAIVLASLLFGAAHLPTLTQMHAFTPAAALTVVLLNAICGCAYGWLFWRRGLEHAMLAHFCTDIVLHVVAPLAASH